MPTDLAAAGHRFDLTSAPMMIGKARLRVRDLDRVSEFYQNALGLRVLNAEHNEMSLGAGHRGLLELVGDTALSPRDPHAAGLFHTAFLLPDRSHLGRWLAHARESRLHISGASDHGVSEAIYLADPEGNGIEVYADRPPSVWAVRDGRVDMPSDPLDLQDLLRAGVDGDWAGMPDGSIIGHMHLQVGDTAKAETFYRDVLGLSVTCRYPGGSFFGSGGYHHQLAANTWNSRGAGMRSDRAAGLAGFEIRLRDKEFLTAILDRAGRTNIDALNAPGKTILRDPWGTEITLQAN